MPRSASINPSDPLSDVLAMLNLRGGIFVRAAAKAPWGIAFAAGEAHFHVVERGALVVSAVGLDRPLRAVAGDLVIFPRGQGHAIADRSGRKAVPLGTLLEKGWDASARVLGVGVGEPDTRMICGTFTVDAGLSDRILTLLPPVLHLEGRGGRPAGQLDLVLQIFLSEVHASSPGSALSAARLIDLILIYALRDWLVRQPTGTRGWLGALRDPYVGAALAALHQDPAHAWTVEQLAARVGLSRSPLASRFTALVGDPPLRYLTQWRMLLAAQLLQQGLSVREVAERVGYASEAAFSRTFKKYVGKPPIKMRASGT